MQTVRGELDARGNPGRQILHERIRGLRIEVLRFKDGWGLAEFYPESLRQRRQQEAKPKSKKPSTKPAKMVKPRKGARGAKPAPKRSGPTIDARILDVLTGGPITPHGLSARLEAPSNVVGLALGRLTFKRKVEKGADGRHSLATQPALRAV